MKQDEPYKIFISCGTPFIKTQEDFLAALEIRLKSQNCIPIIVGRNNYSIRQPVEHARDLIADADGALIIAFERFQINDGLDKPGSNDQSSIKGESYPTIWNQLEGAMAYAKHLPILTLVQKGIRRQGMLSDRVEWFALEDNLLPELLATDKFNKFFQDWLSRVKAYRLEGNHFTGDVSQLKINELLEQLTPAQFWSLLTVIIGILLAVAGVAFKLGQYFYNL
jgi:hypothetical protein